MRSARSLFEVERASAPAPPPPELGALTAPVVPPTGAVPFPDAGPPRPGASRRSAPSTAPSRSSRRPQVRGRPCPAPRPAAHRGAMDNGCVVGVAGGSGGVGASVLVAALGVRAVTAGRTAVCVDGQRLGGGLDVTLGLEQERGLRWPDLAGRARAGRRAELLRRLPAGRRARRALLRPQLRRHTHRRGGARGAVGPRGRGRARRGRPAAPRRAAVRAVHSGRRRRGPARRGGRPPAGRAQRGGTAGGPSVRRGVAGPARRRPRPSARGRHRGRARPAARRAGAGRPRAGGATCCTAPRRAAPRASAVAGAADAILLQLLVAHRVAS